MAAPAKQGSANVANWVQLTQFRAGVKLWVNLDLAAQIKAGGGAFQQAAQIVTPGVPDLYVEESVDAVAALAGKSPR